MEELGARERQIMDAVYRLGRPGVREVLEDLPDDLHYSTVRTMLNKLAEKGHLRRIADGRRYRYVPTTPKPVEQRTTLRRVIRNLFDGSAARAMATLLDLDARRLTEEELDELTRRIEDLRRRGE
ncbi:MAG: BlaI/MecI/CopY family transcriptional regulator [Gemmatimonadota bacterium]